MKGLIAICSYCKKIQDDHGDWRRTECTIEDQDDVAFSSDICPECYETRVKPEIEQFKARRNQDKTL